MKGLFYRGEECNKLDKYSIIPSLTQVNFVCINSCARFHNDMIGTTENEAYEMVDQREIFDATLTIRSAKYLAYTLL